MTVIKNYQSSVVKSFFSLQFSQNSHQKLLFVEFKQKCANFSARQNYSTRMGNIVQKLIMSAIKLIYLLKKNSRIFSSLWFKCHFVVGRPKFMEEKNLFRRC